MNDFLKRVFELPASWEESFSALQWASGCAGVEIRGEGQTIEMAVFFAPDSPPAPFDETLWSARGVSLLREEAQPQEDWAAAYRAQAEPIRVGSFVLDPREPDAHPPVLDGGETWLRLPARTAFGTGSHESTRLALELLFRVGLEGRRVLDVGTGTGVLAFVAALGGALEVLGFDIDPAAALVARENAGLNRIAGVRLFAGRLAALAGPGGPLFDLVLVNVLPHNVRAELALLDELIDSEAQLIFSGLTVETEADIEALLGKWHWRLEDRVQDQEWVALGFSRGGPV